MAVGVLAGEGTTARRERVEQRVIRDIAQRERTILFAEAALRRQQQVLGQRVRLVPELRLACVRTRAAFLARQRLSG